VLELFGQRLPIREHRTTCHQHNSHQIDVRRARGRYLPSGQPDGPGTSGLRALEQTTPLRSVASIVASPRSVRPFLRPCVDAALFASACGWRKRCGLPKGIFDDNNMTIDAGRHIICGKPLSTALRRCSKMVQPIENTRRMLATIFSIFLGESAQLPNPRVQRQEDATRSHQLPGRSGWVGEPRAAEDQVETSLESRSERW